MFLSHPQTQPKIETPKKCKYSTKATGNATLYMYTSVSESKIANDYFKTLDQAVSWSYEK